MNEELNTLNAELSKKMDEIELLYGDLRTCSRARRSPPSSWTASPGSHASRRRSPADRGGIPAQQNPDDRMAQSPNGYLLISGRSGPTIHDRPGPPAESKRVADQRPATADAVPLGGRGGPVLSRAGHVSGDVFGPGARSQPGARRRGGPCAAARVASSQRRISEGASRGSTLSRPVRRRRFRRPTGPVPLELVHVRHGVDGGRGRAAQAASRSTLVPRRVPVGRRRGAQCPGGRDGPARPCGRRGGGVSREPCAHDLAGAVRALPPARRTGRCRRPPRLARPLRGVDARGTLVANPGRTWRLPVTAPKAWIQGVGRTTCPEAARDHAARLGPAGSCGRISTCRKRT
ncbi:hypothetical protein AMPC_16870 [Anaeromyxobacter paludicola]|uniref:Uncharacterized protein n=1 Tax=Anaeromyxobacter paludicola TaxID=2918171 RepID=A0ABM7X9Q4_9BACT|nr:hypothetical protein AMPC_16870 [Anaeromyxobacter paludicola]